MIPIHKLLSRIQWDRKFGSSHFDIGYYDRVEKKILKVSFTKIIISPGEHHSIQIMDRDGIIHSVPLHRIKEVYKDSKLIWRREH